MSCSSGICDGLLLSYPAVPTAPGQWGGQGHSPAVGTHVSHGDCQWGCAGVGALSPAGGRVGCSGEQE